MPKIVVLLVLILPRIALGQITTGGSIDDDRISIVYEAATGELSLDAAGKKLTTLEIRSRSGLFGKCTTGVVQGLFDVSSPKMLFKLEPAGVGELSFGSVVPIGMSADELAADLSVSGSVYSGGSLGDVDLVLLNKTVETFLVHYVEVAAKLEQLPEVVGAKSIDAIQKLSDIQVIRNLRFVTDEESSVRFVTGAKSTPDPKRGIGIGKEFSIALSLEKRRGDIMDVEAEIETTSVSGGESQRLDAQIEIAIGKPGFFSVSSLQNVRVHVVVVSRSPQLGAAANSRPMPENSDVTYPYYISRSPDATTRSMHRKLESSPPSMRRP